MGEFERDLDLLLTKLRDGVDKAAEEKLTALQVRLIQLRKQNVVKINHTVMELVCAKHLILKGYDVDVERLVNGGLTCDLCGVKGYGTLLVEVETGFVPPEHALDPMTYCKARIASKIARYSNYADKFGLGTPPHYIMQIPPSFTKAPRHRSLKELEEIKRLCDLYYKDPPVSLAEIRNARLHSIYIIDVEKLATREMDPSSYSENTVFWRY
ncbi:hypothetical protein GWO13_05785 [Candidatus Bathyarchaeota archaeon]|nr:hypothetical protein [Candidatus Bathyarchaeota archaeon]